MATIREDKQQFDPEAVINLLDQRMARLRVLYEQYFLGIEKRPPLTAHKEVVRIIRLLEAEQKHITNTGLKFRFTGLMQKFNTYRTYWSRTMRQIEDGTYIRHKQKIQNKVRRQEEEEAAIDAAIAAALAEQDAAQDAGPTQYSSIADDFLRQLQGGAPAAPSARPQATASQGQQASGDGDEEDAARQARLRALKARLRGSSSDAGPTAPSPAEEMSTIQRRALQEAGISRDRLDNIYRSLVNAKQQCSEPTANISMDSVARSIAKQAPTIREKHGANQVDFQVVIKNGRAYLKPVPK